MLDMSWLYCLFTLQLRVYEGRISLAERGGTDTSPHKVPRRRAFGLSAYACPRQVVKSKKIQKCALIDMLPVFMCWCRVARWGLVVYVVFFWICCRVARWGLAVCVKYFWTCCCVVRWGLIVCVVFFWTWCRVARWGLAVCV